MNLAEAARKINSKYPTLHDHAKAGILRATWVKKNGKTSIQVSEDDLYEYLRVQELRFLMTQDIMSRIMVYVDGKLGEKVIDKMSDEVNNTFQLKIESGIAYLLRKLKC
jgi:DNA-binding PadR family transcriptional regulator